MTGTSTAPPPHRPGAALWVTLVILVGLVVGLLVAVLVPPVPGPPGPPGAPPARPLNQVGQVVSVIDLALLVALLVVYVRTYSETRARFALGLVVFLAALVVQTLAGSSLVLRAFGFGPGGLWPFLTLSYSFEVIALSVFLYLSLE